MDIVIYSKENCQYCEKIKQVFGLKQMNYVEYKLDVDFTRQNFIDEFGENSTFPRILIDGKLIGGASETISYLKENNLV
jgi:glutaredoxin